MDRAIATFALAYTCCCLLRYQLHFCAAYLVFCSNCCRLLVCQLVLRTTVLPALPLVAAWVSCGPHIGPCAVNASSLLNPLLFVKSLCYISSYRIHRTQVHSKSPKRTACEQNSKLCCLVHCQHGSCLHSHAVYARSDALCLSMSSNICR